MIEESGSWLLAFSFWLFAKSERLYRKGRKERKGKRIELSTNNWW